MALLEIRELASGYGEVQVLWGAGLDLRRGHLTCLVGTNGAGKTTLLGTVMGLIRPWAGRVLFEGKDVSRMSTHAKADMGLVLVPEGRQLFGDMTTLENLEMGATGRRARQHARRNLDMVFELFPRLKERRGQMAGTMSGGEQQMLAVARGLMAQPAILMIDELSLGLAPVLMFQLFESLKQLKQTGLTMLLVEQNVHMALAISDYAYVLDQGRIELEGPSDALIHNEHVRAAYLGL